MLVVWLNAEQWWRKKKILNSYDSIFNDRLSSSSAAYMSPENIHVHVKHPFFLSDMNNRRYMMMGVGAALVFSIHSNVQPFVQRQQSSLLVRWFQIERFFFSGHINDDVHWSCTSFSTSFIDYYYSTEQCNDCSNWVEQHDSMTWCMAYDNNSSHRSTHTKRIRFSIETIEFVLTLVMIDVRHRSHLWTKWEKEISGSWLSQPELNAHSIPIYDFPAIFLLYCYQRTQQQQNIDNFCWTQQITPAVEATAQTKIQETTIRCTGRDENGQGETRTLSSLYFATAGKILCLRLPYSKRNKLLKSLLNSSSPNKITKRECERRDKISKNR